ncbi:MAG TPA: IPT/TIG domain-containing protein [Terriglobales bacterium]|nr:IPT/TIG domain-containing protein [Terriglobales bacterium]
MKTVLTISFVTLIALMLACGYSSKSTPPVAGTMPAISALNPESVTAGGAAFMLTVNGSNFGAKAVVNWNGAAQTANTTYVSAGQLTVAVPASLIANSGTVSITVTNPATAGTGIYGTGATLAETSSSMSFTIN